ncbi:MAG: hypothetical protein WCT04_06260 [Planctomycetota bacterium]
MKRHTRKENAARKRTSDEIKIIDGIPVEVGPPENIAIAQRQRAAIRKQLERMAKSGDPWAMKKAEKWAWIARERKVRPFWISALADVNPNGNVYRGLFTKTTRGWFGHMAEFPSIIAAGKDLEHASKSLAKELTEHLKAVDEICDENQSADGIIVGLSDRGKPVIWIGRHPIKKSATESKISRRPRE